MPSTPEGTLEVKTIVVVEGVKVAEDVRRSISPLPGGALPTDKILEGMVRTALLRVVPSLKINIAPLLEELKSRIPQTEDVVVIDDDTEGEGS